jgi:tetratricopeptide (TPR) repeat protein
VEVVTSDDPTNRRAIAILADLVLDEEVRARAIDGLKEVARRPSGDPALDLAVRGRLGTALAQEQRYAEAAEALRLALEIDPDEVAGHWHLARALEGLGSPPSEVVRHLERVAEAAPEEAAVHYHLGLAYERSEEREKAAGALRRALELADDDSLAWLVDARTRIASLEAERPLK